MQHILWGAPSPLPEAARFLEVGFGDGACLEAARRVGYGVTGLELDERLVGQARQRTPEADIRLADLADSGLPQQSFDLVYSWHTIEHVLDVRQWLVEIHRILRPGGRVLIGTESADAVQGKIWCAMFRLLGKPPWPPTSTDHTYWFTTGSLEALLTESGFTVLRSSVYENAPDEAWTTLRHATPRGWLAQGLYVFSSLLCQINPAWGGKMVVLAMRPPTVAG